MLARIINPPAELYLDGLFCYQQIQHQTNDFIKWRYSRLAVLGFYSALEAAINSSESVDPDESMASKWKTKFKFPEENTEWQKFCALKSVRIAISHYDGSSEDTKKMYNELELQIDKFYGTTRNMLAKLYGDNTMVAWEAQITPYDATETSNR